MKKAIVIAAILAATISPAVADEANPEMASIMNRCKAQWPHEHSMRLFCVHQQIDNAKQFFNLWKGEAASGELRKIIVVCYGKWDDDLSTAGLAADWPMVIFCYEQEREAWMVMRHVEGN